MAEATKRRTKDKSEKHDESVNKQLDFELSETFPASDPPSLTQPASKPGAPERKSVSGKSGSGFSTRTSSNS